MNLLLRNTGVISKHAGIMEVTQLELQKNYHSEIKFSDRKMSLEQKHIKGLFEATTILHDEVHASV